MMDPTFRGINRLLIISFKNGVNDPTRHSFDKYYMLPVEMKDFNALIKSKSFTTKPIKKQTKNI